MTVYKNVDNNFIQFYIYDSQFNLLHLIVSLLISNRKSTTELPDKMIELCKLYIFFVTTHSHGLEQMNRH